MNESLKPVSGFGPRTQVKIIQWPKGESTSKDKQSTKALTNNVEQTTKILLEIYTFKTNYG